MAAQCDGAVCIEAFAIDHAHAALQRLQVETGGCDVTLQRQVGCAGGQFQMTAHQPVVAAGAQFDRALLRAIEACGDVQINITGCGRGRCVDQPDHACSSAVALRVDTQSLAAGANGGGRQQHRGTAHMGGTGHLGAVEAFKLASGLDADQLAGRDLGQDHVTGGDKAQVLARAQSRARCHVDARRTQVQAEAALGLQHTRESAARAAADAQRDTGRRTQVLDRARHDVQRVCAKAGQVGIRCPTGPHVVPQADVEPRICRTCNQRDSPARDNVALFGAQAVKDATGCALYRDGAMCRAQLAQRDVALSLHTNITRITHTCGSGGKAVHVQEAG